MSLITVTVMTMTMTVVLMIVMMSSLLFPCVALWTCTLLQISEKNQQYQDLSEDDKKCVCVLRFSLTFNADLKHFNLLIPFVVSFCSAMASHLMRILFDVGFHGKLAHYCHEVRIAVPTKAAKPALLRLRRPRHCGCRSVAIGCNWKFQNVLSDTPVPHPKVKNFAPPCSNPPEMTWMSEFDLVCW